MSNEDDPADVPPASAASGLSRRGLLRGAAGLGVVGLATGMMFNAANPTAGATASAPVAGSAAPSAHPENSQPMVAHIHDAGTGEVDLFIGTRHIRFTDHQLAARLAQAAN